MTSLVNQSARDSLTRAYTRRVGEEILDLLFSVAVRGDKPIAVVFFDLDNFKSVNDSFGHEEGDHTLQRTAEALRTVLRYNDVLVRWGGEEFLVIMPSTGCGGGAHALERLRVQGLGQRPDGRAQTASAGVAERTTDACMSWQMLVERADRRMYTAKQNGKHRVVLCDERIVPLEASNPSETPGIS